MVNSNTPRARNHHVALTYPQLNIARFRPLDYSTRSWPSSAEIGTQNAFNVNQASWIRACPRIKDPKSSGLS